jgi:putative colanic acid biosynthesis glycosyltransferase WcaI
MFTERFPPELRSAAHLFHELAIELQRRGHEVAVITKTPARYVAGERKGSRDAGWESVDGVTTLRVRGVPFGSQHPIARGLDHLLLGLTFARSSRQWPRADAVLVYSPPLPLAYAAAYYRRCFGAPVVLNVQDLYPQTAIDLGLLRNRVAIFLAERLEATAYREATRIVVHSAGNAAFLTERKGVPAANVRVIYNWVDTAALRPGPKENAFRRDHGLSGKFVVSYAGVMGYAQDLGSVIKCADILRADPEVVFLLAGEGVFEARWKSMAAAQGIPNIRFLPLQPKERYGELLAASDACLVPLDGALKTPVVPGKLQSIMAAGRPAIGISEARGDTPKLLNESGGGIAVAPSAPLALADAIRQLKVDSSLRDTMGIRGRAFAEKHFSIVHGAHRYEAVFNEVIAETRRAQRACGPQEGSG